MAITITSPVTKRTFKSNGTVGDIAISGTYTGSPTAIEASFNGGAYATIVATPAGGNYSGTLSNQAVGQGTLTVRFTNDIAENASVTVIGVGLRFAIAGQSNAAGYGNGANYYYSASGIMPTLFGNDYNWKELLDPTDSATNQVDTVSSDLSCSGSAWTVLSTYLLQVLGYPVEFIPCALTSTSMASWQPGADHQNRATLYGSMVYRSLQSGGVNAVLFWQGENDAIQETTEATYNAGMDTLADAIWTDLGCKLIPCTIFDMDNAPYIADNTAVNNAIRTAWSDNSHIVAGPDFADIKASELTGIHFGRPHSYMVAIRWWYAVREFLGLTEAIRQSNQYWATANTVNCSFKKNIAAGSLIVVAVAQYGGTIMNATSISDNNGNTYALIGSVTSYSGDTLLRLGIYYAYNTNAGATIVTYTGTSTPSITLTIHEYTGIQYTADPLDRNQSAQSNSGAPNSGNTLTTQQADELLFGVTTPYGTSFMYYNPGTSFKLRNSYTDGNWTNIIATEDRVVSATDVYAASFTESAGVPWIAKIATFKFQGAIPTEEAVSLGKILKVTQPFSGTEEGTTLTVHKGVSVSEQVVVQNAVSLAKFKGVTALSQVVIGDLATLARFIGVTTISDRPTIVETVTLSRSGGLTSEGVRGAIEESVTLAKFTGITALSQLVIADALTLAKFIGITTLSQVIIGDTATLARFIGVTTISDRPTIVETVTLSRSSTQSSGTQTNEKDTISVAKFVGITVLEETQGLINETVTLTRSVAIAGLLEGISHVSENVSVNRLIGISEIEQCQVNDNISLNQLIGITGTTQCQVNDNFTLTRSVAIAGLLEGISHVSENVSVNRLIGISEIDQCQVNDIVTLTRSVAIVGLLEGISHVSENVSVNRLIGISEIEQCQVNDNAILNRLIGINVTTQCQVNDILSLAKFIRITVVEETRGQYSESVIFDRFIGLTVLQEGISHVTESVSVNRLNAISIIEQSKVYNSLIVDRLNGITVVPQTQGFNNLTLSKSNGLSINSQSIDNENITVNKFNGLNINSQIVVPELITLSHLYGFAILDSRYLLESVNLQYGNGLSVNDTPTVFETIELGRIDIVTIMTVLFGYNNITLDQYKSIIAEPPSLYVYNDGNHSTAVLFRDKRAEALFRDKRASVRWRNKRGG